MSLFSILHSGSTALSAQGRSLQTSANNVANAETPGYTRQRAELSTRRPLNRSGLLLGQGVRASTISASYDSFAQRRVVSGLGRDGFAGAQASSMRGIETALGEGENGGIGQRLSELFDAFEMIESDPVSPGRRLDVLSKAEQFSSAVRRGADFLQTKQSESDDLVSSLVDEANLLAQEIAGLNANIRNLEAGDDFANDLRVQRMTAVEALSAIGPTRFADRPDGGLSVLFGGHTLVEGSEARALSAVVNPTTNLSEVHISQGTTTFDITSSVGTGGKLGATIFTRDVTTQNMIDQLDDLAFSVATQVNAVHQAGFDLNGATGADFFAPPAVAAGAASTLVVDAGMVGNTDGIAASGSLATIPGGNTNIAAIAALSSSLTMTGGTRTFSDFYAEFVSTLGAEASSAYREELGAATELSVSFDARDAVTAVSLEEEAIDLIRFQEAYQAAARVISTTNGLFDDLMSIV